MNLIQLNRSQNSVVSLENLELTSIIRFSISFITILCANIVSVFSPIVQFSSCLLGEVDVHLSDWTSTVEDHWLHCSSHLKPTNKSRQKHQAHKGVYELQKDLQWDTNIMRECINHSGEHSVSWSHGGQVDAQLHVTYGVTAQILHLITNIFTGSQELSGLILNRGWWAYQV